MKNIREINEKTLNELYRKIFTDEYTDDDKSEANKVAFMYNCDRFNFVTATFRLTLIYAHKADIIYDNNWILGD